LGVFRGALVANHECHVHKSASPIMCCGESNAGKRKNVGGKPPSEEGAAGGKKKKKNFLMKKKGHGRKGCAKSKGKVSVLTGGGRNKNHTTPCRTAEREGTSAEGGSDKNHQLYTGQTNQTKKQKPKAQRQNCRVTTTPRKTCGGGR